MLGTLIHVASQMLQFEQANSQKTPDLIETNRLCQEPRKGKDSVNVLSIDLKNQQIAIEDYDDASRFKYLYAVSAGGHGIGASWVIDWREKALKRIVKQKKITHEVAKEHEVQKGISELRNGLKSLLDKSEADVLRKMLSKDWPKTSELKSKLDSQRYLVSVKFDGKWLGEQKEVRAAFSANKLERGKTKRTDGRCAVCQSPKPISASLPFKFSGYVDKAGFSPLAAVANNWKYAPVCDDCLKWLNVSNGYLESHLSVSIAGSRAYLIPDLEPGNGAIEDRFIQFLWEFKKRNADRLAPRVSDIPNEIKGNDKSKGLDDVNTNLMDEFLHRAGEIPFRSLSLVFYQPGQKFMFLHTTSDILPKNLIDVNERLSQLRSLLLGGVLGSPGRARVNILKGDFNFVGYAWSWPKGKRELRKSSGMLRLNPILLLEAILLRKEPVRTNFWSDVDNLLRVHYLKTVSSDSNFTVKQILAGQVCLIWTVWNLLYHQSQGETIMESNESAIQEGPKKLPSGFWEKFFAGKRMLDIDAKRALFLIGVMFGRIEYLQRKERESRATGEMPIIGRLRGLTVSYQDISTVLFPEFKYKLRQLSGWTRAAKEIEAAAAYFLSDAATITDEEARFYFSLGWSLDWHTFDAVWQAVGKEEGEEDTEESTELETQVETNE